VIYEEVYRNCNLNIGSPRNIDTEALLARLIPNKRSVYFYYIIQKRERGTGNRGRLWRRKRDGEQGRQGRQGEKEFILISSKSVQLFLAVMFDI